MPSDPTPNPPPPPTGKPRRRPAPGLGGNLIWVVVLGLLVAWFIFNAPTGGGTIEWGEFWTLLEHNKLKKAVVIGNDRISGEFNDLEGLPEQAKNAIQKKLAARTKFTVERIHIEDYGDLAKRLQEQAAKNGMQLSQEADHFAWLQPLLVIILPAVILLALFLFLLPRFRDPLGGGFLSNYIKSPARRYERSKMRVTFDDVAGMQNAKSELQEVVEFLRAPEKFQRLGAVVPKGVLLVGPPGTGKTLLARAVAGEAGVPFYSISGSEFIQMFVGVGASVTGDTPILVRTKDGTRLTPIGKFVDGFYGGDEEGFVIPVEGVQALGFEELDSKFKGSSKRFVKGSAWSRVRGVYRHRVTEIYEIHYLGGIIRTTADHSVFVRTRDGIKAVATRDLKPGDVLVNLPLKVRGAYSAADGTLHTVRGHSFTGTEPRFLQVREGDESLEEAYAYALANRGILTQQVTAEQIGVCQATVSNWQTDLRRPRALSDRYAGSLLPEQVPVTPELMRLFGYYTAEGRNNGNVQFVFGTHETELHADCAALGERLFGLSPRVDHTEDNSTRITFYSASLGRFFERHCGNGSRNKHVPELLWDLPRAFFLAYLEGYTKGDGYIDRCGRLSATSVSQQLILELAWLCAMHGIKTGIRRMFTPGGRVIKNTPLPDEEAWVLIIGKTSNPFGPGGTYPQQGKKAIVRQIVVRPFNGYVYDLCGCDNEAFFGGDKPILLHNSRVRDMFKTAKENSPAILFIDEIDAVGRMRGAGVGGGSDEREQTLNQILSEMDGFTPTETVIVMAATNRPDVLDSALLRPGRFDRHITIDRPTWQGRLAILKVHTRNKPLADDVNLETIARGMIGMTGADLRNLANEAALLATRENKNKIDRRDFERAADRVLIGAKREEVLSPEEKRRTAYHEAGHAVVTWLVPEGEKPMKVSIVPRGRTGGVNLIAPDEDRYHHGMDYFKAKLVMMMGGRAIERLIYGQPYAGVEMDLKQATRLARYMVTHWGMSDRLGPMSFRQGEEHVFLGKEIQEPRDFSEETAAVIDEEVQKLLREADEHAYELLKGNRDKVERIVDALMQREELLREEIDAILNEDNNGIVTAPRRNDQVTSGPM